MVIKQTDIGAYVQLMCFFPGAVRVGQAVLNNGLRSAAGCTGGVRIANGGAVGLQEIIITIIINVGITGLTVINAPFPAAYPAKIIFDKAFAAHLPAKAHGIKHSELMARRITIVTAA